MKSLFIEETKKKKPQLQVSQVKSLGNFDENYIWDKFREGDEDALVYIYRKYADSLVNYGSRFCRNQDLLKDALQELFLHLIKNRANLGPTSSIKFYLFKSFRRKVIEKAKLKPQQSLDLDLHEHNAVTRLNPESIFIDEQLDRRQKLLLAKALEQLSPVQKEVVSLYFFEGFSYEKIAEIFEYSHTRSVRNLVYKAIDKMTVYINDSGLQLDSIILLASFNYIFQV